MLHALAMTIERHEATFGVLEVNVERRVRPGGAAATEQKAAKELHSERAGLSRAGGQSGATLRLARVVSSQGIRHDFAVELNQTGIRFAQQGRLEEPVLSFRRALQVQPGLAQAHNNLGIGVQDQGRLEEAVASYRRALALKPDYAMAYNNLGTALKEQGKLEEAVACFRHACRLKPDDLMACTTWPAP